MKWGSDGLGGSFLYLVSGQQIPSFSCYIHNFSSNEKACRGPEGVQDLSKGSSGRHPLASLAPDTVPNNSRLRKMLFEKERLLI